MAIRTISFASGADRTLAGRLYAPDHGPARAYAVFAHCFTCTKNLTASRNIAKAMSEQGIATLVFDFTGLGESEGDFADSNFSTNVEDLVAAADFLEDEYEAPRILVGHSLGGTAVLKAAAAIDSAVAVATIASPAEAAHVSHLLASSREDIERDGEAEVLLAGRPFRIRKQFLDDIAGQNVLDAVRTLRKAYLVLHAPLDDTVQIDNASTLFAAAKHPKSFVSLDDADHLLSRASDSRYAGAVIAQWAARFLEDDSPETFDVPAAANAVVARTRGDGYRTAVRADGHPLVADEPAAVGGSGTGPTPYDYLATALATCTTMTLKMYAAHKKLPLDQVTATVTHAKIHGRDCEDCESDDNARVDVFERVLEIEGNLSEAQRARMVEIADRCPVHRTLHGEVKVRTRLAS